VNGTLVVTGSTIEFSGSSSIIVDGNFTLGGGSTFVLDGYNGQVRFIFIFILFFFFFFGSSSY
jgi:hypothetical protein